MDQNELKTLNKIDYQIRGCCKLCANVRNSSGSFSTCKLHKYFHLKHQEERELSVYMYGYCDSFKLDQSALNDWLMFTKEK